ncbi:MAG: hypothetical protein ACPGOV_16630 [Magnetovibrionaceae bacterium]
MAIGLFDKSRMKGNVIIGLIILTLVFAFLLHAWGRVESVFNGRDDFLSAINAVSVGQSGEEERLLCTAAAVGFEFEKIYFIPMKLSRREAEAWLGFIWDVNPLPARPSDEDLASLDHWVAFTIGKQVLNHFPLPHGRADLRDVARIGGYQKADAIFDIVFQPDQETPFKLVHAPELSAGCPG